MNEWETEPNRKHWVDEVTGYDCLIVRGPVGALCGYVGVPFGHPWYGRDYGNVDADVHGGLTFSDKCDTRGKICHSVAKGDNIAHDDVWWLGFDCAHYGDLTPKRVGHPLFSDYWNNPATYRNMAYVENECRSLAAQVKAAA